MLLPDAARLQLLRRAATRGAAGLGLQRQIWVQRPAAVSVSAGSFAYSLHALASAALLSATVVPLSTECPESGLGALGLDWSCRPILRWRVVETVP